MSTILDKSLTKLKERLQKSAGSDNLNLVNDYLMGQTKIVVEVLNERSYIIASKEDIVSNWIGGDQEYEIDDDGTLSLEAQLKFAEDLCPQLVLPDISEDDLSYVRYLCLRIGDFSTDGRPEYTDVKLVEPVDQA